MFVNAKNVDTTGTISKSVAIVPNLAFWLAALDILDHKGQKCFGESVVDYSHGLFCLSVINILQYLRSVRAVVLLKPVTLLRRRPTLQLEVLSCHIRPCLNIEPGNILDRGPIFLLFDLKSVLGSSSEQMGLQIPCRTMNIIVPTTIYNMAICQLARIFLLLASRNSLYLE